jgi:prephenate dehydrogenase
MKNLTIIGFGNIGEVFTRELKSHFNITVGNRSDKSKLVKKLGVKFTRNIPKSVENADYVILAIPISEMRSVVKQIKESVPKNAVVLDCCAVKQIPLEIMAQLPCKIMGTHPQFRKVKSVKGKSIVLVGSVDSYFKRVLQEIGLKIIRMTAEEHDKNMAIVGLGGLIGLNLIKLLNPDERKIFKKHAGTASRHLVELMELMEGNPLQVYEDIQRANPYSKKLRQDFIQALAKFDKQMDKTRIS